MLRISSIEVLSDFRQSAMFSLLSLCVLYQNTNIISYKFYSVKHFSKSFLIFQLFLFSDGTIGGFLQILDKRKKI